MNYKQIYEKIIDNATKANRIKGESYFELHHITPVSLGGSNDASNLVLLTAREHFICHALLMMMFKSEDVKYVKMALAFNMMCANSSGQRCLRGSRLYEVARRAMSDKMKKHNPMANPEVANKVANKKRGLSMYAGKSEEARKAMHQRICLAHKGITTGARNGMFGKNIFNGKTKEEKQAIVDKIQAGRNNRSPEEKRETADRIRKSKIGKNVWTQYGEDRRAAICKKLSNSHLGGRNSHAKPVLNKTTGERFDCMNDVTARYGYSYLRLSKCLRGLTPNLNGNEFVYA